MRRASLVIWIAVGLFAAADIVLCGELRLRFDNWGPLALAAAVTGGLSFYYRISGRSPALAAAAHWTLLWLLFVNAGTVLTYAAAAGGGTLRDAVLAQYDAVLGFDWRAWYTLLAPHVVLRFALWLAYSSLFPQILFSIFWFSATGHDERNYELLLHNIFSLLATIAIFALFPAIGLPVPGREGEIATVLALRMGQAPAFELAHLHGIISFPSYHTVLAVLLTYAYRRSRLLPVAAALNALMLFSIPSFGRHYLIDMIAGAAVALVAIPTVRRARIFAQRLAPAPLAVRFGSRVAAPPPIG